MSHIVAAGGRVLAGAVVEQLALQITTFILINTFIFIYKYIKK